MHTFLVRTGTWCSQGMPCGLVIRLDSFEFPIIYMNICNLCMHMYVHILCSTFNRLVYYDKKLMQFSKMHRYVYFLLGIMNGAGYSFKQSSVHFTFNPLLILYGTIAAFSSCFLQNLVC